MSADIEDKDTKKGGNDAAAGPSDENLSSETEDKDAKKGGNDAYDVEWLDLSRDVIHAKQKKYMARALESGELKKLKSLYLHNNAGDLGVRAMLNALQQGSGLPNLETLILWDVSSYDQITKAEEGTDTIANAIGDNKMPKLQRLDLSSSLPKLIPPRPWMEVFRDLTKGSLGVGRLHKFKNVFGGCCCTCTADPAGNRPSTLECCCHMRGNYIYSGNDGLVKIVEALSRSHPPLKVLNLRDNHIGDKGIKDLAKLLGTGVLPLLEELDLQNNPVSKAGEHRIVLAYLQNPLLTASVTLDWSDPVFKERASALREKNLRLEHRLEDPELVGTKMEQEKISTEYKWKPKYSIQSPSRKKSHSFRLHCQIVTCASKGDASEGILIKEKPLFSTPSRKLVNGEGEARIFLTPGTGFIKAAKFLESQQNEEKEEKTKTERVIDCIIMELLMFADRKPPEFREMFGLARVLLEDQTSGCHYPAYICETCRVSQITVVKPPFLELRHPAQQLSSGSQPV